MLYSDIVWDFDGTLFNSYPAMSAALHKALLSIGIDVPKDELSSLMQISTAHAWNTVKEKYGLSDGVYGSLAQRFVKFRTEEENASMPLFDGVQQLCSDIAAKGGNNYLLTHRDKSALEFMEKSEIKQYFSGFVTAENGFPRKPNPQGMAYLIEKYSLNAKKTLMIGDRDLDIMAGLNCLVDGCYFSQSKAVNKNAKYNIYDFSQLYKIIGI